MLTIIIFGIIGLIVLIKIYIKKRNNPYSEPFSILEFMFNCTIMAVICCSGVLVAALIPSETKFVLAKTYRLESLQDNNSLGGSFFLGTGTIRGKMKYTFYYEECGFYKLKQIDCDEAIIRYTNENPRLEELTRQKVEDSFINYFTVYDSRVNSYIFYVPKGTIKQNYLLNAE